jgi:hypothetical protein
MCTVARWIMQAGTGRMFAAMCGVRMEAGDKMGLHENTGNDG